MKSVGAIRAKFKELSGIDIRNNNTPNIGYQRWLECELVKRHITLDKERKSPKKYGIFQRLFDK